MIRTCAETGELISEEAHILQSIGIILKTRPNTLPHLREFGCRIWDYLDEPISEPMLGAMENAVIEAIEQFEPRAKAEQVAIEHNAEQVTIQLTLKTKQHKSFSYFISLND